MKIEYKKEAPGMIRIISKIEGLLTPSRCIEEARRLLKKKNTEELKDPNSIDLLDSILLSRELADDGDRIRTVVFSANGEDIIVNEKNIDEISAKLLMPSEAKTPASPSLEAIEIAVKESLERG